VRRYPASCQPSVVDSDKFCTVNHRGLTACLSLAAFRRGLTACLSLAAFHRGLTACLSLAAFRRGLTACLSLAAILAAVPSIAQTALPDSLAQTWSTGPSWWQFVKVMFFLVLILGLIWVALNGLKKVSRKGGGSLRGVEIVGGLALGPRRSLVFVKIGCAVHVIGATDHHLSSIAQITSPEDVAAIISNSSESPSPTFGSLLRRMTNPPADGGSSPHA